MLKLKEAGFDTRYASLVNVPQAMLLLIQVYVGEGLDEVLWAYEHANRNSIHYVFYGATSSSSTSWWG